MSLTIKQQLVSARVEKARTYGGKNPVDYITVHQTGNTNEGANAKTHANLQSNLNPRNASWHYTVDDSEAYQSFKDTAQCWHAGDGRGPGNLRSIGVEICVNSDGDYKKAVENGAKLVAILLKRHGLSADKVRQHYDWSKKNCPAQIRAGKDGITWTKFVKMVEAELNGEKAEAKSKPKAKSAPKSSSKKTKSKPKATNKSIAQMAQEVIDGKHGNGHENRRRSLGIDKATYEKVRAEVNRRLTGKSAPKKKTKSISQMADEIIRGLHGNGHEQRRKSLGIDKATYEKVRKEVNRRFK